MPAPSALRIAGLTPLTTIDFPGRIAAIVWLRGCALRCFYCHNKDLQSPDCGPGDQSRDDLLQFLRRRKGLLDGLVFSGGEPLLQGALTDAVRDVRNLGFEVALHTAGPSPERLARLLPLLDWVGFDVKAPFESYACVTGFEKSGLKALESLRLLKDSGVPFEVRTTVDPSGMDGAMIDRMAAQLYDLGISRWVIQEATGTRLPPDLKNRYEKLFEEVEIRG
ncbi:MAG TPA: anaerobic ribonucleoside-triphosphate reductase activating protein, partial [Alphaproteobacteria bacterium]|nr:anaerobic ribonucleoside-triphosphate reductase activating protein [Alphaproteobacteria bacterium]